MQCKINNVHGDIITKLLQPMRMFSACPHGDVLFTMQLMTVCVIFLVIQSTNMTNN